MGQGFDDAIPLELLRPAPRCARRRAWWCFAAVATGAAVAHALPEVSMVAWLAGALVAGVVVLVVPRRFTGLALLAAVCLCAAWWFDLRTSTAGAKSPESLIGANERVLIEAEALVLTSPAPPPVHRDQLARFRRIDPVRSFDASLSALASGSQRLPARGRLRVSVAVESTELGQLPQPGDRVRLKGWYTPPRAAMNPGQSDPIPWDNMEGNVGALFCSSPALVEQLEPHSLDRESAWIRAVSGVRQRLLQQIEGDGANATGRAVLGALLLGEIDPSLRDTRSAFQRAGTAHLLAISGFHLAVLCGLGLLLVRLTGDRGRLEAIVVGVLVLSLLVLVPARVPIVRAGVLVLALLLGDALGRRYDRLTMLGWITIGLFLWPPMDVFSLGAQLSVGITALLIWLASVRHPWVSPPVIRGVKRRRERVDVRMFKCLRSYVVICVLCWALALPVVAAHTGTVSLVGPVATVLVTPAIVLLLALGYLALLIGLLNAAAGVWLFAQLARVSQVTAEFVEHIAGAPGMNLEMTPPSALSAGVFVLIMLAWLAGPCFRNARVIAALLLLVGFQAMSVRLRPALPARVALRIDTLAVGDGTCHIVRSGDEAFIWDCGSLRSDLRPVLERALPALGISHASTGFVTHANLDHFVSMPEAVELLRVERIFVSPHVLTDPGEPEQALLALLEEKGVEVAPISRGAFMPFGNGQLEFLWPGPEAEQFAFNDRSLVCRVSVQTEAGQRRLLLCGDIQTDAMMRLLGSPAQLQADVLEMPHHGSFRTQAMSFLAAVDPRVVIQSTGPSRVGDPRWADHRASRTWFTTAEDGAPWVEIHTDGTIKAGSVR